MLGSGDERWFNTEYKDDENCPNDNKLSTCFFQVAGEGASEWGRNGTLPVSLKQPVDEPAVKTGNEAYGMAVGRFNV